jgi:hypothetical protein
MRKIRNGVIVLAAVAMLNTSSLAGAASLTTYQKQYVRDFAPWSGATSRFYKALNSWKPGDALTMAALGRPSDALAHVAMRIQHELLDQRWPGKVRRDVRALYNSLSSFEGTLYAVPSVSVFDASTWASEYVSSATRLVGNATIVRHDLGLSVGR